MKLSDYGGAITDAPGTKPSKLSEFTGGEPIPSGEKRSFWGPIPGEIDPFTDVAPALINFATAPFRALAGDIYATANYAAKEKIAGGHPTIDKWWQVAGRAAQAGALPETSVGQQLSNILNLPGEALGSLVSGASRLTLGEEKTHAFGPFAKVAVDVAAPFVSAKLLKIGEPPEFGPAIPKAPPATTAERAADVIAKRIAQEHKYGGLSATDAIEAVNKGRAAGKPMTLADVGGENIKALAGYTARLPGEGRAISRSFLESRDKAAAQRLGQDIDKYVSSGPSMVRTTDELLAKRSAAARPLYQKAESLQGIWSPRLQEFLAERKVRQGLARGYELERLNALSEGRPFDPTQLGIDLDFEGNIVMKRVPNLRVLDMGKRGLDAMIADERDPVTGRLSALGMELSKVRNAYVNEIDSLDTSGVYRAAREAWAGPSQSLDSVRWGRAIFNRSPEESARDFGLLSPNNQEFARLGVADMLRERLAKVGFMGNEARALIKNPWTREQLRPIFKSDEDFDKFSDAVMAEHEMAGTMAKTLRGSQTAERLAEDKTGLAPEIAGSAIQAAGHVIRGNFPMALVHAWRIQRRLKKDIGDDPELSAAVAKILFDPNIDLSSDTTQRIIAGPPPSSHRVQRALGTTGRVGGAAATFGVTDLPTTQ